MRLGNFVNAQLLNLVVIGQTVRENLTLARLFCFLGLLAFGSVLGVGQTNPNLESGVHNFGSYHGGDIDIVNLVHGGVNYKIPLTSYSQRGGIPPVEHFFQDTGKKWGVAMIQVPVSGGTGDNVVYPWMGNNPASSGGIGVNNSLNLVVGRTRTVTTDQTQQITESDFNYWVATPDGSVHNLDGQRNNGTTNGVMLSVDTSGFQFILISGIKDDHSDDSGVLVDRNGTHYFYRKLGALVGNTSFSPMFFQGYQFTNYQGDPKQVTTYNDSAAPTSVVDANGNIATPGIVQGSGVDTLGRSVASSPSPVATNDYSGCSSSRPITSAATLNYPGVNGGTYSVKLCYASVNIATAFSQPSNAQQYPNSFNSGPWTMVVSIVLPDHSSWAMDYDSYGNITSIAYPTGGTVSYQWQEIAMPFCEDGSNTPVSRAVKSRTLFDGTSYATWQYSWGTRQSDGTITNIVTDPAGNDTAHVMSPIATPCGFYETQTRYYQGTHTTGTLLKTVDTTYSGSVGNLNFIAANVVPKTITTTLSNGLVSQLTRQYDPGIAGTGVTTFGNVTLETVSDWGPGAPGAVLRQAATSYQWQADTTGNYLNAALLDLPASVVVKDSSNRVAETDYTYDESSYLTAANISTQHGAAPSSVRGNLTTSSKWLNTSSSPVVSHTNWYDTGEVFKSIDPLGNTTTHSYDPAYAGAYSTQTCNTLGQCYSGTYDFNTGLLTSLTDANGSYQASGNMQGDPAHTTTWQCNDPLGRVTQIQAPPDLAGNHPQTSFSYPNPTEVDRSSTVTGSLNNQTSTFFDGLGRPSKSVHASAGNATVVTGYDSLGRVASVTNPYFSPSDPTYGVTQTQYDALGRVKQVTKQDGSIVSMQYDQISPNSADGDCTTTTDEAGKSRKSCVDGLGRLIEVDEPQASSGSMSNPYVTLYGYDVLGNMLSVNQKGDGSQAARIRTFTYDSLSRLLTATNPESGQISYGYDANGNLLQKTSPAPNQTGAATQTISYCYDQLNRVTGKAYSAQGCPLSSPVVTYSYDSGTNGIGRLSSLTDQAGSGSYSYDALGRITGEQRTIASVQKSLSYTYNLDNSVATLKYPSGAVITYTPDAAGRTLSAVDIANNINYVTGAGNPAAGATYAPDGSILAYTNGWSNSFAGVANSFSYNSRLQPVTMAAVSPGTTRTSATASVTISGSIASAITGTIVPVSPGSQLALLSPGSLFFEGTDGNIYNPWGTPLGSWHMGCMTCGSGNVAEAGSPVVGYGYDPNSNSSGAYYVGPEQHLHAAWWSFSTNSASYADLTALGGSNVAAGSQVVMNAPGSLYYLGSSGSIQNPWGTPLGTWHMGCMLCGGATPPLSTSPVVGYGYDQNSNSGGAYYVGTDQHLHAAWWSDTTNSSSYADLTALGGSNVASGGQVAMNAPGSLYYVGSSGSIQNPWGTPLGAWHMGCMLCGGATPPLSTSPLVGYGYDQNTNSGGVYYVGTDQHLHAAWWSDTTNSASFADLTALGGSNVASGSQLATDSPGGLYYVGSDGNVYRPWGTPLGSWHIGCMTCGSGAPASSTSPLVAYYSDSGSNTQGVYYVGSDQHLHAAWYSGSTNAITNADLTVQTQSTLDSGTVSLNVGGFTATACFGNSTNSVCSGQPVNNTPTQVATALAQALNASSSPVTATASGATINMTWKAAGPFTTPVSALSTTHDHPSLFPNPSFTNAATSFSGGTGANLPVFNITYDFHLGNGDNGNVFAITNNRDASRSQTFAYDALNRLASAQNAGTDCTQKTLNGGTKYWGNSYGYDPWGNLLSKTPTKCSAENLAVTALSNNRLSGYGYDAAGNMTHDATTGNNYSYDPENRITGAAGFTYTYDADGNRVEKSNGSTGTIYWPMSPGIVAETDLAGNLQSEYVFFNGKRVARHDLPSGAVAYYFADHLGTASVITNLAGTITADEDFYPHGGELPFINNDSNHYKHTGNERDSETGLDYRMARYSSNQLGRFLTPDWAGHPTEVPYANFGNPQSLNLYTYGKNNPTTFGDPDGHCAEDACIVEGGIVIGALAVKIVVGVSIGVTLGYVWDKVTGRNSLTPPPPPPPPGTPSQGGAQATSPPPPPGHQQNNQKNADNKNRNSTGQRTARKSSKAIRNQFEKKTGEAWPKDQDGKNLDVSHKQALADGGTNDLENIEPKQHDEHMQMHMDNGDFQRWGSRANQTDQTDQTTQPKQPNKPD